MQGTITWLPATEENIIKIPLSSDNRTAHTVHVLCKWGNYIRKGFFNHDRDVWHMEGIGTLTYPPTHFAFINEPE